ncbi:MAG: PrsW family intramembrane metalloprotease [Anaerolineales bacterium]|nr:PrsW family intramembrane metalloprotease [Anaerolineales bacterium]
MQTNKNHWPSILILLTLAVSALGLMLIILALGASSLINLFSNEGDPAGEMIGAVAFGFELLILFLCLWMVFQKTRGSEQADQPFKFPYSEWQIFAALGMVIFAAVIGGVIAFTEIKWLTWIFLPLLTLFVIVPPIWLLFGIGTKGIELGPRWRIFSALGLGMTVGPVIMIVLEMIILLGAIIIGSVIIAIQQPELFQEIAALGKIIQQETNQDAVLKLIAPYITNPLVIASLVGYISVLVPLVEELLKPLAVWIFALKIETPAQGFAMGMLSGAAFALIESLNASGNGSTTWPIIVSIRAGTSLLHMTTSGLVGWGIVSAFREKDIAHGRCIFCAVRFTASGMPAPSAPVSLPLESSSTNLNGPSTSSRLLCAVCLFWASECWSY